MGDSGQLSPEASGGSVPKSYGLGTSRDALHLPRRSDSMTVMPSGRDPGRKSGFPVPKPAGLGTRFNR